MDLIAVLLQARHVPLLQHSVRHQQLEESPVDIGHDAHSSGAALHGEGAERGYMKSSYVKHTKGNVLDFAQICINRYKFVMVFKTNIIMLNSTEMKRTQVQG